MFFDDYSKTQLVYHIAHITDLDKILAEGLRYDDKISYKNHYHSFHDFIDKIRPEDVPSWVIRKKAIFATMNYKKEPSFHSHTAVLGLKVDPTRAWIANESKANEIYEPFILQDIQGFAGAKSFIETKAVECIKGYWDTSLDFQDNLKERRDLKYGYDAEVMILKNIPSRDIQLIYIVSDHRIMTPEEWRERFCIL